MIKDIFLGLFVLSLGILTLFSYNFVNDSINNPENEDIIHIPDANFKAALLEDKNINKNGDNEIQRSEAKAYNLYITCRGMNISDFTGLEEFTSLEGLFIEGNNISNLDLSKNTALTWLDCRENKLSTLDLSNLKYLKKLDCSGNELKKLDLTNTPYLRELNCQDNKLEGLKIPNFLLLLKCSNNALKSLDLSDNKVLQNLEANNNQLSSLNFEQLAMLKLISISKNNFSEIDITNNKYIIEMDFSENQLNKLNLANGNNNNVKRLRLNKNTKLSCIKVDNMSITDVWLGKHNFNFHIDQNTSFSTTCN